MSMTIREARKKHGLDVFGAAMKAGMSYRHFAQIETGLNIANAEDRRRICEALGVTEDSVQWPPLAPEFRPNHNGFGPFWFEGIDTDDSSFLDLPPWNIAGTRIHLKYGSTAAFAKDAGMTPDDVHAALQRRRGLTFGEADRWAKLLDLPMKYTRHFFVRVETPEPIRPKPEPPTDRTALGEIVGMNPGSVEDGDAERGN